MVSLSSGTGITAVVNSTVSPVKGVRKRGEREREEQRGREGNSVGERKREGERVVEGRRGRREKWRESKRERGRA